MAKPIKIINVKILSDGEIEMDNLSLGMQYEKNATKLVFEIPDELKEYNKTIEFSTGDDKKFTDVILNNEYLIDNNISCCLFVSFQVTFTDADGIEVFKTIVKDQVFDKSINAVDPAPSPEEVSQWNTLVTTLNEKIKEVGEMVELEDVLRDILEAIEKGGTTSNTITEIEQIIVSYFENKTVGEVEE